MKYIYNICIYIYWLGIFITSWFNNKAKLFIKGREDLIKRIENEVKSGYDITWIHCSSVGEFEQARPIIEKIKKENNSKILLTFFSPSGYELRKNYNLADWVYYMPVDTRKNAKAFIKAINPKRAIFVKYEFWYNHLYELKRNNIEIYIISAIFRPGQIFFKWYGFFFRKMLHLFTILFVQDERSKELLEGIGITNNVIIGGDTRFDRVNEIASKSKDLPIIGSFAKDHFTIVAGSSWEPDELMLAKTLKNFSKAKLILVPHEIEPDRIKRILQIFSEYKIIKYTDISSGLSSSPGSSISSSSSSSSGSSISSNSSSSPGSSISSSSSSSSSSPGSSISSSLSSSSGSSGSSVSSSSSSSPGSSSSSISSSLSSSPGSSISSSSSSLSSSPGSSISSSLSSSYSSPGSSISSSLSEYQNSSINAINEATNNVNNEATNNTNSTANTNNAANNSTANATNNSINNSTNTSANNSANNSTNNATNNAINNSINNSANNSANNSINNSTANTTNEANDAISYAINGANVIIIDTIGMLSSIYKYGNCAYIGGGFGVGIHNILEAATYGIPVIFGPNYYKFKEAKDLLIMGGAYSVKNDSEFYEIFTDLIKNRSLLESKGLICKKYVESNLGATNKIYQKIF